jgi:osmotically-inducible protein OsmY
MDDLELQHAVAEELEWAPRLDASHVAVSVRDGIVRLTGYVGSLAEKKAAERAVWHVRGVRGIAEEIDVAIPAAQRRSDDEIAHRAASALCWDTQIPGDRIQIKVESGLVTLIGWVEWQFQKIEAEELVHRIAGVVGVDNQIIVHPTLAPADIKTRVERAFSRHAKLNATGIAIQVDDRKVTLTGHIPSVDERNTAENAAWSAAGVAEVDNRLVVQP